MLGIVLVGVVVLAGGLAWCYYTDERDRMYHWGIALAILVALGAVGLAAEFLGYRP